MSIQGRAAWTIDHAAYPVKGPPSAQLEFLVRYAVLAPSTHNSQPWLFRVRGDALELFADRSRALPISDPHDRELTISCGAALAHALLAARNFGHGGHLELLPEDYPDLLGRLRLGSRCAPTNDESRRFRAITERRTTRTAFAANDFPPNALTALAPIAEKNGSCLTILRDLASRKMLAELVAEANQIQMDDPRFRDELAQWLHSSVSGAEDGMSVASFGYNDHLSTAAAQIIRTFDLGAGIAARDRQLAAGSPVLAILSTASDSPIDWLHAGMALADILLEVTASGLQAAYLNQPIEVPSLREKLRVKVGLQGMPQILLRLGKGAKVPPAARREARHVIGC